MESIILLKGKVKFSLTIDPSVWIFDERKVDLTTYFDQESQELDELSVYTKAVSEHWDREIKEGAQLPSSNKNTSKKYEKEKLLTGTFGIPVKYFLENALPDPTASQVIVKTTEKDYVLTFEEVYNGLFGFSKNGKPLTEDGPAHFYFGDGSNRENPLKHITALIIE
ncbi:peptidyl-prolyl cis-trans isomerase [Bacillus pinisoli]|uniref:peptidyl-prolyl cis-trans isomerase n=1 Tax=Bacillus pinisoli TaxID=2901866 RepID=UPI001FF683BD|nr:peptidyl-prolyl cis-trans isomerase [Bacillus pinisoli]